MRNCALSLILCCLNFLSNAQVFTSIYEGFTIPSNHTISTTTIAAYINNHFDSDRKKVTAIYKWVASNIRYDTDSANNINLGIDPEAKITSALRRRKGVCENFAAVFNDICTKAGFTSFVVDGYTKQNGFVDKIGHSWCAVFLENEWQLCDPTWDAGGSAKWFLLSPSEMINTHMPFDPMWQLLENTVSHRQFSSGIYGNKNKFFFNYRDSIAAYVKMDSLQRYSATARRIEQSGLYNNLVQGRHKYNTMHVEILREEKDVELYNAAVADLNVANNIYNNYARYRNDQFTPLLPDKEISGLLDGIDIKLKHANTNLDEIEKSEAIFKFSTEDVRIKLKKLAIKVNEQKDFLKVYIATDNGSRQSLFFSGKGIAGK